jgi:uncharacterized protein (TIGR02453 family)
VENRLQNSRAWFNEHRGDYQRLVLEPLRALVTELTPTMLAIDPLFTVEPKVNKTIARIYRDTRYTHDKSLYRDFMWVVFMRNKKFWAGLPGYYFSFGPDGIDWGVGYYEAPRPLMEIYREMILARDAAFLMALEAYEKEDWIRLAGDRYKRPKYPEQPENIRLWLDMKNIDFEATSGDYGLLYSPAIAERLKHDFKAMAPMYDFICAAEARRPRDGESGPYGGR